MVDSFVDAAQTACLGGAHFQDQGSSRCPITPTQSWRSASYFLNRRTNHLMICLIIALARSLSVAASPQRFSQASPPSEEHKEEIMKFAIRAGLVALTIGSIPSAFAGESGTDPNMSLTEFPGVIAEAPAQNAPAQGERELRTDTRSSHNPWLFPPIGSYLDPRARG
jgi:hypothetical protein